MNVVRWDVLGVGCATVDDLLLVEAFPQPDAKTPVAHSERQCGGLTASALVAAARLGARCAYGSILGRGPLSRFVADALTREGIDLRPVVWSDAFEPIHSTIIVDTTRHTRAILFERGKSGDSEPCLPDDGAVRSARVLLVDHYALGEDLRVLRTARAAGLPVVADFERYVPGMEEALALVDHLVVSSDFAGDLVGAPDPARAAAELQARNGGTAVVTCGPEGCFFTEGSAPERAPAFRVEAVDTTGCGDVFHGAYAAELAAGRSLSDRIRIATGAAALKAMRPGSQAGAPTHEALDRFLETARTR